LALAVCVLSTPSAFAAGGVYGSLSGTVTDAITHAPIANATVRAVSPSQSFTGRTDAGGHFTLIGVSVDTYSIIISAPGHASVTIPGVTVYGDQNNSIGTASLGLQTIGGTHAHTSVSNAYQPQQTTDAYTINPQQIALSTGKAVSTNENAALLSVPGITLTNNNSSMGTQVTIRGGAAYEVGYQLDGVPFREPFLNGNGSFGLMNGVGNVQVVEGAGDATQAGVGAGVINVVPQRGSGPGSGTLDIEAGAPNRYNQYGIDYGFSTPDNRFSEYFAYVGDNLQPYYGYTFTPQYQYGNYFATQRDETSQFLNNFFFKFGKDKNQQIQVLYLNISQIGWEGNAGPGGLYNPTTNPNALVYYPYDTLTQGLWGELAGWSPSQYASLIGLSPGTPATDVPITQGQQAFSNQTRFLKLEYDNNLSDSTYLAFRYYNWETLQSGDDSYTLGPWQTGDPGISDTSTTGGPTSGVGLDLVHQFGSNLTVTLNGEYDVLRPIWDGYEPQLEAYALYAGAGQEGATGADWLPGGVVYDTYCPGVAYSGTGPLPSCDPRLPSWGIGYNGTEFQNWGGGIRVQYNPTGKLHLDLGVRDEGQNQHWYGQLGQYGEGAPSTGVTTGGVTVPINNPYDVLTTSWTNNVLHPTALEPRGAASYQFDPNDSIRVSYGRSAVFANAQTGGTPFHLYGIQPYLSIPAKAGSMCGWAATALFPCQSYAAELYWAGDNLEAPDAGNGLPAIYNNYDFSYNHLFSNGMGMRITPFYKEGTDLPTFFLLNPVLGIFAVSNQGLNKTTGAEFDLTTPQRAVGISGFFAATYQNVLSTTAPFTTAENAVPLVSSASLALHDLYRAGYVSPASFRIGGTDQYKSGFSISPQIETNIGYPYSIGNMIAAEIGPGVYANIPQVDFGPGITGGNASLIGGSPGAAVATNYYDPSDPGSSSHPNIDATRGTPGTSANGGYLSHWNMNAAVTLQYKWGRSTIGIQFLNLFGNAYNGTVPSINPWYQPVANGKSGPQTGSESCVSQTGSARGCWGSAPIDTYAYTNGAYLLTNGNFTAGAPTLGPGQPFTTQLFYQLKI
jgi:hypothetical protein